MENNKHDHNSRTSPSWSELPLDLLISVLERLSVANIQQAKSVCSSWYSASTQTVSKNQFPLLILFPKDNDENKRRTCTLFSLEEKHKLYKTRDLGVEFAKSDCMATYGSWLLMRHPLCNMYILNLSTHERISLPWMGVIIVNSGISPVFWIDEETKDYVVVCGFSWSVFYTRTGDNSWNQIPKTSKCFDMVYKDHMLYLLCYLDGNPQASDNSFEIFDFSGEVPRQTLHICLRPPNFLWLIDRKKLVVTVTGEILMVEAWRRPGCSTWFFRVFKIYSLSRFIEQPERIYSLGQESILFYQGITLLVNDDDTNGFRRNSIYFIDKYSTDVNDIVIFNLETQKTEPPLLHTSSLDTSLVQFSKAYWFFPCFTHT